MRDTEGAAKQNPHVACDVEGAGDVAWPRRLGLDRRASPRPYWGGGAGKVPQRDNSPALYSTSRPVLGERGAEMSRATHLSARLHLRFRGPPGQLHWIFRQWRSA